MHHPALTLFSQTLASDYDLISTLANRPFQIIHITEAFPIQTDHLHPTAPSFGHILVRVEQQLLPPCRLLLNHAISASYTIYYAAMLSSTSAAADIPNPLFETTQTFINADKQHLIGQLRPQLPSSFATTILEAMPIFRKPTIRYDEKQKTAFDVDPLCTAGDTLVLPQWPTMSTWPYTFTNAPPLVQRLISLIAISYRNLSPYYFDAMMQTQIFKVHQPTPYNLPISASDLFGIDLCLFSDTHVDEKEQTAFRKIWNNIRLCELIALLRAVGPERFAKGWRTIHTFCENKESDPITPQILFEIAVISGPKSACYSLLTTKSYIRQKYNLIVQAFRPRILQCICADMYLNGSVLDTISDKLHPKFIMPFLEVALRLAIEPQLLLNLIPIDDLTAIWGTIALAHPPHITRMDSPQHERFCYRCVVRWSNYDPIHKTPGFSTINPRKTPKLGI